MIAVNTLVKGTLPCSAFSGYPTTPSGTFGVFAVVTAISGSNVSLSFTVGTTTYTGAVDISLLTYVGPVS